MGGPSIFHYLLFLVVYVLPIWPAWRICSRAGFSGAWALLLLIPLVGLVMMYVFAFSSWPAQAGSKRLSATFE